MKLDFVAAVAICLLAPASADARQPNLILIMADDLGYECLGANGGESFAAPNLDRMAAEGMRFDACYVQPLCTPTRVELMTGLSNVRNYAAFGRIDPQATTFAHVLKDAGYATGIAGKWQLGRGPRLPQRLGFDESCLWQHTRRPPRYANPGLEYNGQERDFTGGEYGPDLVSDFALDFVTRHKDRPFFLYYPMMLTHAPYQPTPESADWDPQAQGEQTNRDVKHFGEMVAHMDTLVGRLTEKVDALGLGDDTLILFLGDNGTGRGVTSQFKGKPYPGGKGLTTARGTHVPLIARWPGRVAAGTVCDEIVGSTDFFATLCEAAEAPLPEGLVLDGQSFLPLLRGEAPERSRVRDSWYAPDGGPTAKAEFAMDSTHKLYRDGRLYDLREDPWEERPIAVVAREASDNLAAKALNELLERYADARPAALRAAAAPRRGRRNGGGRLRRRAAVEQDVAAEPADR